MLCGRASAGLLFYVLFSSRLLLVVNQQYNDKRAALLADHLRVEDDLKYTTRICWYTV